jgi:hypothetical protein
LTRGRRIRLGEATARLHPRMLLQGSFGTHGVKFHASSLFGISPLGLQTHTAESNFAASAGRFEPAMAPADSLGSTAVPPDLVQQAVGAYLPGPGGLGVEQGLKLVRGREAGSSLQPVNRSGGSRKLERRGGVGFLAAATEPEARVG